MKSQREFESALLRYLLHEGFIDTTQRTQIVRSVDTTQESLIARLIKHEVVSSEVIASFIAKYAQVEVLGQGERVTPHQTPMTDTLFKAYRVLVDIRDEHTATVYFASPLSWQAWGDITHSLEERTLRKVVVPYEQFQRLASVMEDAIEVREYFAISTQQDLERLPKEQRAIAFAEEILQRCVELGASDIHIEPQKLRFRIRMRINGVLQVFGEYPMAFFHSFSSRVKLIAHLDIAQKRDMQDGALVYHTQEEEGEGYDVPFRVAVIPTVYGEKIVLRKLNHYEISLGLRDLGMDGDILTQWKEIIAKPYGMILVSGPTGCGKSTTLRAAIGEIKSDAINILTVEDPVEAKIPGITQVEIDSYKVSFAEVLRGVLRQDPDLLMVGEIRDSETAKVSLRAALTGHMVYSTIHTNDAPSTITRLLDMGIEPFAISSTLVAVLAQRLVRVLCPVCKSAKLTTPEEMHLLSIDTPQKIYTPRGCKACINSGYSSRIGVYELLVLDETIRRMINSGENDTQIKAYAMETLHMPTLFSATRQKVLDGETSLDEFKKIIVQ